MRPEEPKPKLSFFLGSLEKEQRDGELDQKLTRLTELGFKAVEFSATDPSQIDVSSLSTQLDHCRLRASALLTGGIYSKYRVCFASPESSVREEAVRRLAALMPVANQLSTLLVIGLIQGQRADAANRDSAQRNIID